jgi:hypothetical protein
MAEQQSPPQLNRQQRERLLAERAEHATPVDPTAPEPPQAPTRQITIEAGRIILAEFGRNEWIATATPGTTIEEVRDEGYFAHRAKDFRPYDRIEMRIDDGSWLAELLVLEVTRTYCRTALLNFYRLTTDDVARTKASQDRYAIKFRGPHLQFSVIRNSDNVVMSEHHRTMQQAESWLRDHEKSQV